MLLTGGGVPVQLGLVAGHAAADGSALSVLREEWLDLLHGRELPPLEGTLTPLELRRRGGRPGRAAQGGGFAAVLGAGAAHRPAGDVRRAAGAGRGGPAPRLTLRSARGGAALARAAARLGVPGSTVLLTAWCALVAHRAGQDAYVGAAPTANRYKSALARTVTPLSQDALLHLEVARAAGFDALLKSAWAAALNAYRHSRFDALELWAMIDRVTAERGSRFGRDVVFNDVSGLPGALRPAAGTTDPEPGFELTWGPEQVLPTALLCFVHRLEPVLELALWPDPQLFDRDEAAGFLAGLVRLLEAAAEGDVPLAALGEVTGVRPPGRGGDWRLLDGCWVSPAAVAAALSAALDGRPSPTRDLLPPAPGRG
ncbi:condensation domain-containing protein [Kitasatospora fiedleri]|uniref:hypothetical protein n=1 Tax=Kitasatospora fiedleri TaxID=2991545 RepID=UPI002989F236|nr:hypothetical protein [Kitasatospora fiedleri]